MKIKLKLLLLVLEKLWKAFQIKAEYFLLPQNFSDKNESFF